MLLALLVVLVALILFGYLDHLLWVASAVLLFVLVQRGRRGGGSGSGRPGGHRDHDGPRDHDGRATYDTYDSYGDYRDHREQRHRWDRRYARQHRGRRSREDRRDRRDGREPR